MPEFDERFYSMGFRHAINDISHEGLEYAERYAANAQGPEWYSIGYNTAVDAYKEGRAN